MKVSAGFGGRYGLSYERRMSDLFAIETGVEGGENFLDIRLSKLTHIGTFIASNFYFKEIENVHQFYISPRLDISFGRTSIREDKDWRQSRVISVGSSVFAAYRYRLPFNATLEAGLGIDAVSLILPLEKGQAVGFYSLAIPKIQLGFGYAF